MAITPLAMIEHVTRLPRIWKRAVVVATDSALCVVSVIIGYSLRIGLWQLWSGAIAKTVAVALVLMLVTFVANGVYRAIFRYAGRGMMRTLLRAGATYAAAMMAVVTFYSLNGVPRTLGMIQPIILLGLIMVSRLVARYLMVDLLGRMIFVGKVRNLMIYGAGDAGQLVASSLRSEPSIQLIGYLDDDERLHGQRLDGIEVYRASETERWLKRHDITDVLLALPGSNRIDRRRIVDRLQAQQIHVQTLPPMKDIVHGKISVNDIRELDVEDLLGREPVAPNELLMGRTIIGKTVLVTGAGGSIGSELCRQILVIGARCLILFEVSEFALYSIEQELAALVERDERGIEIVPVLGSVVDERKVSETLAAFRPDTVFHAAAYKHVPLVEANPLEGIRNNVLGTYYVVRAAEAGSVSDLILISTDKAVRPPNVMGATKRAAELVLQAHAARPTRVRFSMVRFGNVLGSSGSVVPLFRAQIASGGPITLTHRDVTRYFMTIPEAAMLVIQAGGIAKGGEVFVLDMGQPVRIADLAQTMVRLSGLTVRDESNPSGDIAIAEVGMRPGEKLHEELLIRDDPQPTQHPRILMAREHYLPLSQLASQLEKIATMRDPAEAVELLAELVPEFAVAREKEALHSA